MLIKLEEMIEPELRAYMNACAKAIEGVAVTFGVERPLFALVLFNDAKVGQYVGNCRRSDMIAAMRETADRLERREDVTR